MKNLKIPLISLISIAILAALLGTLFREIAPERFGSIDLIQYWGGGYLLTKGSSPYNREILFALERSIGVSEPITIWNPPWTLPLLAPLALLSFQDAVWVWAALMCLLYIGSFQLLQLLWSRTRASSTVRVLCWVTALSSYPMALALWYGQISPLILFGLVLFLYYSYESSARFRTMAAGIGLALTAIKPHALLPLYIYLFISKLRAKNLSVIFSAALTILALSIVALAQIPEVFDSYLTLMQTPPLWWKTPSLGSWAQQLSGENTLWVRNLPLIITTIGLAASAIMEKSTGSLALDRIAFIIPIALMVSPYSWLYDQVLLLPSMLWVISTCWSDQTRRWLCFIPILLNILVGIDPTPGQEYYLWYPSIIVLLVLAAGRQSKTMSI